MTDLIVRRLLVDLETPLPRHWCAGDAFRTAWFNALSMSFPVGEQFFIDSVRAGLQELPEAERERFDTEARAFVGQEATHRRLHGLFNDHLARQGLVNRWAPRAQRRMQRLEGVDVRAWVGLTAATEHFTAILAEYLLGRSEVLHGTEPRLAALWLWHSCEESEHRSTAFDLYRALGGNELWRLRLFRTATVYFLLDALRQTANNLWHDGSFWHLTTWSSGWRFLLGRHGVLRGLLPAWQRYLRADFHPSQQDDAPARAWLREHAAIWQPVGQPVALPT